MTQLQNGCSAGLDKIVKGLLWSLEQLFSSLDMSQIQNG